MATPKAEIEMKIYSSHSRDDISMMESSRGKIKIAHLGKLPNKIQNIYATRGISIDVIFLFSTNFLSNMFNIATRRRLMSHMLLDAIDRTEQRL